MVFCYAKTRSREAIGDFIEAFWVEEKEEDLGNHSVFLALSRETFCEYPFLPVSFKVGVLFPQKLRLFSGIGENGQT